MNDGVGAMHIDWNSSWDTGIEPVDKDHKVLVSLINQVYQSVGDSEEKAVLSSVLDSLTEYTEYHFAREEKLQEVAGYADLGPHRERHRLLVEQVKVIGSQYARDPSSVQADKVLGFLKTWLVEHILKHDMAYRDVCCGNKAAIAAAEAIRFGDDRSAAAAEKPRSINWASLSVLVIEDNRNFQMIIQTILKSVGVRNLAVASSGAEGLEKLEVSTPDLILCDWRMEGMDGLAFVQKVRASGLQSKIIMMSGYSQDDMQELAKSAGADAFIEKPITARGVMETAIRVLL